MANSTDIKLLDILRNDNVAKMEEYLTNGGNPDYFINRGEVPLNLARSKEMAQLLIDKGANTRMHTRGRTPIIWQAMRSNPEVIKVLLNHDPKLIYDRAGLSENRETLLHKCILSDHAKSLECIKILLAHKPAIDINGVTDDGDTDEAFTPLDYAVHTDNPLTQDIIKLLIDHGAVRRDTRPAMYDAFVKEYKASKKIGKFMKNVKSKRNTLRNAWQPGGEAYEALKNKVNRNGAFSKARKTRKNRRKTRKSTK